MTLRHVVRVIALPILMGPLYVVGQSTGWQANPATVEQASKARPGINYVEARVPPYTLPDVLNGTEASVRSPAEWQSRRAEILELFREHVYGRSPGRPDRLQFQRLQEDPTAMAGAATLRRIAVVSGHAGREHRFEVTMFLPNARRDPVPVFLLINNRPGRTRPVDREEPGFWPAEQLIARGYGIAALQNAELAPDDNNRFRDGVIQLFEGPTADARPANAWSALAAWAWGARRAMDYFETDSRIDAQRVAVVGHSRGGKAALWAGAEDERFALVVSNESGEGGAALSRRQFGETLERLTTAFPHWFATNYSRFARREDTLPVDQHMLLALVAPRLLYVAGADADLWSDPRGEFLSLAHASPVYGLWGYRTIGVGDLPALDRPLIVDRRGYHVRTGGHNLTPYDWDRFADFADARWKREPTFDAHALARALSARILVSRSATTSLEEWCRDHALADDPRIVARPVPGVGPAPTAEQRRRLGVGAKEEVRYRRVQLACGDRVLSEADNWYVPGRLTPEMNRLLDTTQTPFGRVVEPFQPYRVTFATELLWWPTREDAAPIPESLFMHRAVLFTDAHRPFAEVREVYQRGILAFPLPSAR